MSGPSFSTPRSVKPSLPKKRFTLASANKTLPLVRRIANDVVKTHEQALDLQNRLESVESSKDTAAVQADLDRAVQQLQSFVAELTEIGCEIKDYKTGLIDFVGQHQGREVYLCWRLGEDSIRFWHETTAGFAGRKPIATLIERA